MVCVWPHHLSHQRTARRADTANGWPTTMGNKQDGGNGPSEGNGETGAPSTNDEVSRSAHLSISR